MENDFEIVPLEGDIAEAARRAAANGNIGYALLTADSENGYPCRHCLRFANPGERLVLFTYASIPPGHSYSEAGPIFVHAEPCQRYNHPSKYPEQFRNGRVFRAYNERFDMIDAIVANGTEPEAVIENLFRNPETAFVQARSVTRGCYTFGVRRA